VGTKELIYFFTVIGLFVLVELLLIIFFTSFDYASGSLTQDIVFLTFFTLLLDNPFSFKEKTHATSKIFISILLLSVSLILLINTYTLVINGLIDQPDFDYRSFIIILSYLLSLFAVYSFFKISERVHKKRNSMNSYVKTNNPN
jgi:hypothetical protein